MRGEGAWEIERERENASEKPERRNLNTLCDDDRTEYTQCTHSQSQ